MISVSRIDEIIDELGLRMPSNEQLHEVVCQVVHQNQTLLIQVQAGKHQAIGMLIGQVLEVLPGADARHVRQKLVDYIKSL